MSNSEIIPPKSSLASANLIPPNNRYIVAKVGDRLITFPDVLVSEIVIIERSAILSMPFYDNAIVGVIHHQASIMPLVLLKLALGEQRALISESLTVVRLSESADSLGDRQLSGIGLIVDRVIGSLTIGEYQDLAVVKSKVPNLIDTFDDLGDESKKINQTVANIEENEYTPIEIVLLNMLTHIWQPQRWRSSK
ncbi:hypothetical protein HCU40_15180 [Pseudanabaena biceps]|nr:hypothetical protein [Pseudanabaena biceps]